MKDFDYAAWKAMASVRECSACVFYVPLMSDELEGRYRRFPSQSCRVEDRVLWLQPLVKSDDWCGEFVFNPDAEKK